MAMVVEIDHRHFLPKDAGSITKRIDRLNVSKSQNGGCRNSRNESVNGQRESCCRSFITSHFIPGVNCKILESCNSFRTISC